MGNPAVKIAGTKPAERGLSGSPELSALTSGPEVRLRLQGVKEKFFQCILLGMEQGKMHVRSDRWIEPASFVSAVFSHLTFSGEVLYCTRKDTWYRICIDLLAGEEQRRSEPRLAVHQHGTVIALSDDRSESKTPGVLLDLAVAGMRVELPQRVEPGAMIYFETESELVAGQVRRCHQYPDGRFEAGVEVTEILSGGRGEQKRGMIKSLRTKLGHALLGKSAGMQRCK